MSIDRSEVWPQVDRVTMLNRSKDSNPNLAVEFRRRENAVKLHAKSSQIAEESDKLESGYLCSITESHR